GEFPAGQRELDRQHVTLLAAWKVGGRTVDAVDARVGQQRDVEGSGLFGRAVEPQAGRYLVGHWMVSFRTRSSLSAARRPRRKCSPASIRTSSSKSAGIVASTGTRRRRMNGGREASSTAAVRR